MRTAGLEQWSSTQRVPTAGEISEIVGVGFDCHMTVTSYMAMIWWAEAKNASCPAMHGTVLTKE